MLKIGYDICGYFNEIFKKTKCLFLVLFFEKEKAIHEEVLNKLIDFLRGKVNE